MSDEPKRVSPREYLTIMITECEKAAGQKRSELDQVLGQLAAYRDLLVRLGPAAVPDVPTADEIPA